MPTLFLCLVGAVAMIVVVAKLGPRGEFRQKSGGLDAAQIGCLVAFVVFIAILVAVILAHH
jgi:hypothetical protein